MNKKELVAAVSAKTGFSRADTAAIMESVLDTMTETLVGGEEVRLVGFGAFCVNTRAPSEGRNPRTGEPIQIDSTKQPKFKAGKNLKEAVNN